HLIRSAFYVVLLLALCVIPFALAQRNTIKRGFAGKPALAAIGSSGAVPSTGAAPLLDKEARSKAKQAAAAAKKNIGAPGSLAGASQLQQGKLGAANRQLPHPVRSLPPNAPKFPYSSIRDPNTPITKTPAQVSGSSKSSSGPTVGRPMRVLPQPKLPRGVGCTNYNFTQGEDI